MTLHSVFIQLLWAQLFIAITYNSQKFVINKSAAGIYLAAENYKMMQ